MSCSIQLTSLAYAQEELIPSWIRNTFIFWAESKINDTELINAIQYLIDTDIISMDNNYKKQDKIIDNPSIEKPVDNTPVESKKIIKSTVKMNVDGKVKQSPQPTNYDGVLVLAIYKIDGDNLTLIDKPIIPAENLNQQNDYKTHEKVWSDFVNLIPTENRKNITKFLIYDDLGQGRGATIYPDRHPSLKYQLGINIDIGKHEYQRQISILLLVHEFGHMLDFDSIKMKNNDYTMISDVFIEKFESVTVEKNYDNYISEYAQKAPIEDFAESFKVFVITEKPTSQESLRNQKILFFYDYPEFIKLRDTIRTNMDTKLIPNFFNNSDLTPKFSIIGNNVTMNYLSINTDVNYAVHDKITIMIKNEVGDLIQQFDETHLNLEDDRFISLVQPSLPNGTYKLYTSSQGQITYLDNFISDKNNLSFDFNNYN